MNLNGGVYAALRRYKPRNIQWEYKAKNLTIKCQPECTETFLRSPQILASSGNHMQVRIAMPDQIVGMLTVLWGFSTWKGKPVATLEDVYVKPEAAARYQDHLAEARPLRGGVDGVPVRHFRIKLPRGVEPLLQEPH